ncbi:hypothetical protein ABZT04_26555 [Streptomyces sp. NPDC005492]|uniref:hypothetical protein n=1 Tax=Streptomyces sp. NPDC005492 TaxID=3156883 RepID=UPI0033B87690
MPLPFWLQSHVSPQPSPRYTFESFADEVARAMGLPSPMVTGEFERSSETDHVWMLWKSDLGGAYLRLDRPDVSEYVVLGVQWSHAPDPAVVAAMVRAFERRGRLRSLRSLLGRVFGRR